MIPRIYIYIKCWNIEMPSMEFMYIGIWYKFLVFFSESWLCHVKVDRLLLLQEKKRNRQRTNQPHSQFLQYCRKMLDRRKAVQQEVLTSSRPQLKMEEEEEVRYPPSPSLRLLTWWCHRWEEPQWWDQVHMCLHTFMAHIAIHSGLSFFYFVFTIICRAAYEREKWMAWE